MKKRKGFSKQGKEEKGEKPYENPYPLEKFKRGGDREMRKGIPEIHRK